MTGVGDIIVGVGYKPPDQKEEVDEALYRQLEAPSRSQALVLNIYWRNTAGHKLFRRFLKEHQ